MDNDGSPGQVASIDQGTSPKVGKVASEGTSEARASSSSDWRAWNEVNKIHHRCSSPCESRCSQSHSTREARKFEKAVEVMSDVDGPAVEALRADIEEGSECSFGAHSGCADSAVRIFHHEVRTVVGRDRCATSCRARVINRSQGQVGAVAVRGGPVCRPSRSRITSGVSNKWSMCCSRSGMHWRKSCK